MARKITRKIELKDGSKMRICDMTDAQLHSCMRSLNRVRVLRNVLELPASEIVSAMRDEIISESCVEQEIMILDSRVLNRRPTLYDLVVLEKSIREEKST